MVLVPRDTCEGDCGAQRAYGGAVEVVGPKKLTERFSGLNPSLSLSRRRLSILMASARGANWSFSQTVLEGKNQIEPRKSSLCWPAGYALH